MQIKNFSPAVVVLLALSPTFSLGARPKTKDAILLSNVKSLTLRADAKTSHRRVSAINQLQCKGPACRYHKIEIMRCTNQGSDYETEDIQWSCVADVPEEFKLGSTDVICEGYADKDDDYVLKGSCGVEYRLVLTSKGEKKYGAGSSFWGSTSSRESKESKKESKAKEEGSRFASALFMIFWIAVAAFIVYQFYLSVTGGARNAGERLGRGGGGGGGRGGGGGGGGDNDHRNDPPPPYPGKDSYSNERRGYRPGFWTGVLGGGAAGGAAGYAAGSRNRQQQSYYGRGGGDGWGGDQRAREPPARASSSSSGSTGTRETTGFGSTSRR